MKKTYLHEMVDQPATPGNADRKHNLKVDQYKCVACHDGAHAQYAQDVAECTDGTVVRDSGHPVIHPDGTDQHGDPVHHGPTAFLKVWHELNGHCPQMTED